MIIKIKTGFKRQHNILFRLRCKIKAMFTHDPVDYKKIPVIINNFNRLDCLKKQIDWLTWAGMKNIYIIDNLSTYPPLLEFYRRTPFTVFRLDKNVGHTALWDTHIFMYFKNTSYIYTDPDILPVKECPKDVIIHFRTILKKFKEISKIGFGLKIDDLPDHNPRKQEVINWEKQFWENEVEPDLYKARIDTTFALYKPNIKYQQWETTLRTGGKFMAHHLPWYENPNSPNAEESYFRQHTSDTSSWYKKQSQTYNG